ncbi:MAG: zinc ribbon domain-containing protein [Clostridiales bacterium]|jgi:hypothetical protein|nr:zinc ribbon domain-containing protein [Clostridiales bacterium]
MYCSECGKPIKDHAQYCGSCGKVIDTGVKYCSVCGFQSSKHASYCLNCGVKFSRKTKKGLEIAGAASYPVTVQYQKAVYEYVKGSSVNGQVLLSGGAVDYQAQACLNQGDGGCSRDSQYFGGETPACEPCYIDENGIEYDYVPAMSFMPSPYAPYQYAGAPMYPYAYPQYPQYGGYFGGYSPYQPYYGAPLPQPYQQYYGGAAYGRGPGADCFRPMRIPCRDRAAAQLQQGRSDKKK